MLALSTTTDRPHPAWWHRKLARPKELRPKRTKWLLVAITLLGAALRAPALFFPPALTDEAFTFWRVCGSFGQLFDHLLNDAFVPLHYEAVWLLTRVFGTSLAVLRLPSAMAGVAMPYAVYRLGRLLGGRRAGVAAALVAATSAYLGFFARNAKLYMPAWTLLVLALGSLLFFCRARTGSRRLSWLTFVMLGMAATSTSAVMCLPLAMSPVVAVFAARRRRVATAMLVLLATAAVLTPPAIYYTSINTWFKVAGGLSGRSDTGPAPRDNGLGWIDSWPYARSPSNLLIECASAYTAGIEWPLDGEAVSDPLAAATKNADEAVMIILVAFASVALFVALVRRRRIGVLPWAVGLLWAVAPVYGFYLRSFRTLSPPWQLGGAVWALAGVSIVAVLFGGNRRPTVWATVGWVAMLAITLTFTWACAKWAYAHAPRGTGGLPVWNPLWIPRYSGFVAPLLCVLTGGIIAATPTRPLRVLLGVAFVGVNLWISALALVTPTEPPWPDITRDLVTNAHDRRTIVALEWVVWPGQPIFPNLPAPHYALLQSAGLDVDPPGFRAGDTWPYRPGPAVRAELAKLRYEPVALLSVGLAKRKVDQIIVWRLGRSTAWTPYTLDGWATTEHRKFAVRSIWTWQPEVTFDRTVLKKQ